MHKGIRSQEVALEGAISDNCKSSRTYFMDLEGSMQSEGRGGQKGVYDSLMSK